MCAGVGEIVLPRGMGNPPVLRAPSSGSRKSRGSALWAVRRGPFELEAGLILVGGVCVSRGRGSKELERIESLPDLPVGCGRGLRASGAGLRASSSRRSRPPTRCTRTWRRRLRGRAPTGARRALTPRALGRSRGREAGRDGGTQPRPRHAPLPGSTRVSPGKRRVCSPRAHISTRP